MLAIVIPYYKKAYFKETLDSIASQTCKDFVLYIGDDASSDNPQDIIDEYKDKIKIVYHRFEENMGCKDLVSQWERCISLTNNEDWIWLFSDDDKMQETCVQEFYDIINKYDDVQMIRFSKKIKNMMTGQLWHYQYANVMTSFSEFLFDALDMTSSHVTMPECLWRRSLYKQYGIVKFPLAWGSDKATYIQYAHSVGCLYNLKSIVYYRISDSHVSSNNEITFLKAKAQANILYELYLTKLFRKYSKEYPDIDWSSVIKSKVNRYNKILPFKYRLKASINLVHIAKNIEDVRNIIKIILGNNRIYLEI